MEDDRSKRRRITSPQRLFQIHHLPDILLVKVAGYLPKTSRALLAVALTADSSSWKNIIWNQTPLLSWLKPTNPKKQPSPETKAILRMDKWDVLDFTDVGSSIAWKLSDDDIAAVLSCINAVKYLKKLKLDSCVYITGCGLEPLRGSVVLEWVDARLIGWYARWKPMLCEKAVLPILDSILDTHMTTNGNSLKNISLPRSFHTYGSEEEYLSGNQRWSPNSIEDYTKQANVEDFSERYEQHLARREFQCTKCCKMHGLPNSNNDLSEEIRTHSCYQCLNYFCCDDDMQPCEAQVTLCLDCEKRACTICVPLVDCYSCHQAYTYCLKCRKQKQCEICQRKVCDQCHAECKHCNRKGCWECLDWMECNNESCKMEHCGNCYEEGTDHDVKDCESQDRFCSRYCSGCRFSSCSKNWSEAAGCCLSVIGISKAAAAKLQEEKDKSNDEANKLAVDNCRLKEEVNRLTKENNALSNRISIATSVLGSNQASVLSTAIISSLGNN